MLKNYYYYKFSIESICFDSLFLHPKSFQNIFLLKKEKLYHKLKIKFNSAPKRHIKNCQLHKFMNSSS
jgi:hypothetical protein